MCDTCMCNGCLFTPPMHIGDEPKDFNDFSNEEEFNNYLFKSLTLSVQVATREYDYIQNEAILFIFSNSPSFVFNVKPPKNSEGVYIKPEVINDNENAFDEDIDKSIEYFQYIKDVLNKADVFDLAKLFKILEKNGIDTTRPNQTIDYIHNLIIDATMKFEAGEFTPEDFFGSIEENLN